MMLKQEEKLIFKNNTPFRSCISKIDNVSRQHWRSLCCYDNVEYSCESVRIKWKLFYDIKNVLKVL